MLRRVFGNAAMSGTSMFWRMAVSIVLTPFIIRKVGSEAYGAWVLVTSFSVAGYLSLLTLGIPAALVKRVAECRAQGDKRTLDEAISAAMVVFGALGVVGCTGLLLMASHIGQLFNVPAAQLNSLITLLYLVAIQTLFDFPALTFTGIVEGLQRYDIASVIDIGRTLLYGVAVGVLLTLGGGIVVLGACVLVLAVVNITVLLCVSRYLLPEWKLTLRPGRESIRDMASLSFKMFLLRINAVIYNQMDKAIIGIFLTTTLLTDYDIANRLHSLVLVTQGIIASVIMPTSSALHAVKDTDRLRLLFIKGTKYTAAMSVPLAMASMVLAPSLIRHWIGIDFVDAVRLSRLFLAYLVFWALCHVGQNVMIGMDRVNAVTRIGTIGVVINLAVSVYATRHIGVTGVVWGTLVGNAVSCVLYIRLFLKVLQLTGRRFVMQVLVPVYPLSFACAAALALLVRVSPPVGLPAVIVAAVGTLAVYAVVFLGAGMDSLERQQVVGLLRAFGRRWGDQAAN